MMMARFIPTPTEIAALERLFELAEGYGGGAARARRLLCAWYNGAELGGFDFADLWYFDEEHLRAAAVVLQLIVRTPQGTYPNDLEGFSARMRNLAERRIRELEPAPPDQER
jgi:hypothetical protein